MEMARLENSLTRLETNIRSIIEGDAARGGLPRKLFNQLTQSLVKAMRGGSRHEVQGKASELLVAPDQYTLILPAQQAKDLLSHPAAIDRLSQKLVSLASRENIILPAAPILHIVAKPEAHELAVLTEFSHSGVGDSFTTELDGLQFLPDEAADQKMPNAFLIVNGLSTYPLSQSVINIGSDPSNHLVLKDGKVSRMHAQLRLNSDHYVIFNLDSKGSTLVNGVAISSHMLNPGDVIMLAGVPLVYGQEIETHVGYTQKLQASPQPPEVL